MTPRLAPKSVPPVEQARRILDDAVGGLAIIQHWNKLIPEAIASIRQAQELLRDAGNKEGF